MSTQNFRNTFLLALLCLFLGVSAIAQTFRGGISGVITDSSGAAVTGATVTALSTGTGLKRDTTTSSAGEFAFQDLPLGEYELSATQTGFEQLKIQKVAVEVGKVTSLRLTLKVASQSQTV